MSMFEQLTAAFRDFNAAFGLAAAHDYDLPDEPSATVTHLADRVRPISAIGGGVGGPAAPAPPAGPGAAGIHPSRWPVTTAAETVGRDWLAQLYTLATRLGDAAADVVEHIERLDPRPGGT